MLRVSSGVGRAPLPLGTRGTVVARRSLSRRSRHAAARPDPAPGLGRPEAPRTDPHRLTPRHDLQQELLPLLQ